MLGAWRIDPESKLSSMLDVFPGVGIPARKDELEYIKTGADVGYSDGPDQFHMAIAKERTGVDPASGGTVGGIVNPKRGIYSANGTSMVMMQANNRNNLRTGDMRFAHVKLGGKWLTMYSTFGIGEKLKKYNKKAEKLVKALQMYKEGTLGLRLRATTASLNKALDQQNDILMSDRLDRYYASQAQIIQALQMQGISEPMKEYYFDMLLATKSTMYVVLKNFGKDNTDTILPDVTKIIKAFQTPQAGGAVNGNQAGGGSNPVSQVPSGIMGQGGVPAGAPVSQGFMG
jgi:hypothetical protein